MLVVTSLAVVAVCAYWAFPDGVGGVKLFAETAVVWEWKRSSGTTGRHLFVVVLGHGEPPKTVVTGVFYCRGESYPPSTYGFWLVVIRDKSAVVEVGMNAGDDSSLDEAASSFSISNPPVRPLVS